MSDIDIGTTISHELYGNGVIKDKFKNGDTVYKITFSRIEHPLFITGVGLTILED